MVSDVIVYNRSTKPNEDLLNNLKQKVSKGKDMRENQILEHNNALEQMQSQFTVEKIKMTEKIKHLQQNDGTLKLQLKDTSDTFDVIMGDLIEGCGGFSLNMLNYTLTT